jgi:hypothetical protein
MQRRLVVASAIAVVVAAAFLTGSGVGSSAVRVREAQRIPAGLAAAIHTRLGLGPIRLADSPTEQPMLGFAVALSADGTTALVGAVGAHNLNGCVYVYHVASAGSWASSSTPAATLSGAELDGLGWSIALSADGTTAFVGTPFGAQGLGAVYVYHVSSEDAWASTSTKTATLTTGDSADVSFFGESMAASADGTTVVVDDLAYHNFDGGAEVFHVASEDSWVSSSTPTATLSSPGEPAKNMQIGQEVAISGDGTTVLVSDARVNHNRGRAYVFHAPSESAWTSSSSPATLSNASGVANDFLGFGLALSADGTTAFLGAFGVDGDRGAVDVFHVADASTWATTSTPAAILTNGGGAAKSFLGDPVTVSADGTTVVATASGVHKSAGAAYVFHASGEGAWTSSAAPTAALTDSHGRADDELGFSAAIAADGATVLIGAPGVNWSTGRADVFHVADAGSWLTSSTPTAPLTNSALPKPLCIVPRLKGDSRSDLTFDLEISDCSLGKVTRVHSTMKNRKKVISQSPRPGRRLRPGSKINVKIGK